MHQDRPDWRCRLPGPIGLRYYTAWKQAMAPQSVAAFDAAVAAMPQGALCLDLGANVGNVSINLAKAGARVIAFEPDPETFETLAARSAAFPNIEARQEAIGDQNGTATLFRAKRYSGNKAAKSLGSSISRTDVFAMDPRNTVSVPLRSLADVLNEVGEMVHILKIDIEGSEWPLLEQFKSGLGQGLFKHAFVETHERFAPFRLMPKVLEFEAHFRDSDDPSVSILWP